MTKLGTNSKGFTLIELLITTSVFSVFLTILATMSIQIGRVYYKGILTAQTQEAAREIMSEVSHSIQFSYGPVTPTSTTASISSFCAGTERYSYILGKQLTDDVGNVNPDRVPHVLIRDIPATCSSGVSSDMTSAGFVASNQRELVPANMRLATLSVALDTSGSLYIINVKVIYGEGTLICSPSIASDCSRTTSPITTGLTSNPPKADLKCRSGKNAGTQFCAVAELSTIVQKRI